MENGKPPHEDLRGFYRDVTFAPSEVTSDYRSLTSLRSDDVLVTEDRSSPSKDVAPPKPSHADRTGGYRQGGYVAVAKKVPWKFWLLLVLIIAVVVISVSVGATVAVGGNNDEQHPGPVVSTTVSPTSTSPTSTTSSDSTTTISRITTTTGSASSSPPVASSTTIPPTTTTTTTTISTTSTSPETTTTRDLSSVCSFGSYEFSPSTFSSRDSHADNIKAFFPRANNLRDDDLDQYDICAVRVSIVGARQNATELERFLAVSRLGNVSETIGGDTVEVGEISGRSFKEDNFTFVDEAFHCLFVKYPQQVTDGDTLFLDDEPWIDINVCVGTCVVAQISRKFRENFSHRILGGGLGTDFFSFQLSEDMIGEEYGIYCGKDFTSENQALAAVSQMCETGSVTTSATGEPTTGTEGLGHFQKFAMDVTDGGFTVTTESESTETPVAPDEYSDWLLRFECFP